MQAHSHKHFMVVFFLILLSFTVTTYVVIMGYTATIDRYVIEKIIPTHTESLTAAMQFFSFIGDIVPVVIISLICIMIIYLTYKKWQEVFLFIAVMIGSTAINTFTKWMIKRERPESTFVYEAGFSYPSGHTMAAMSLYGIIIFLFWKHTRHAAARVSVIVFGITMIVTIAFSRLYLGVHYISDIIGGGLLSGLWLYVTIYVYQYMIEKQSE
ncbi:phosphatase PAP2 family protein [Alkalihalophilus sp. As8PL]|uniref:Phosphatase PAP2 family protein n=1 Tax=Alkalihalophilus sp. As8PL TaxID=3237103 RepID=A0AB39BU51_9BACI